MQRQNVSISQQISIYKNSNVKHKHYLHVQIVSLGTPVVLTLNVFSLIIVCTPTGTVTQLRPPLAYLQCPGEAQTSAQLCK